MPEYAGYVKREQQGPNWTELAKELGTSIEDAFNVRTKEREAFSSAAEEVKTKIDDYELGQNETLNNMLMSGIDKQRDLIYEWNQLANSGKITRSEYSRRLNNLMTNSEAFAGSIKTFDGRIEETLKRQQPDENGMVPGSSLELENNQDFSQLGNLKGREIYTNPDNGNVYLIRRDEEGNIKEYVDVRQMNNPGNILDNRIYLSNTVEEQVKKWGDWKTFKRQSLGRTLTEEDKRQAAQYGAAKGALIRSILSSDRAVGGVLVDNGAGQLGDPKYMYYRDEAQKNERINAEIEKAKQDSQLADVDFDEAKFRAEQEKRMIRLERDGTGVWQPVITPSLRKEAEARIDQEIEIQVGHEESGTAGHQPSVTPRNPVDGATGNDARYQLAAKAWVAGDAGMLTSAARDGYKFEIEKNPKTGKRDVVVYQFNGYAPLDEGGQERWLKVNSVAYDNGDLKNLSNYMFKSYSVKGKEITPTEQYVIEKNKTGGASSSGGGSMSGF